MRTMLYCLFHLLQALVRFIGDRILSLQAPMRSDSALAWLKVR